MQNAVIIGGGVAGLVSSISLRRIGVNTRIIEARKTIKASNLTYTGLWDPAIKILIELGIYDDVKKKLVSVRESSIRSMSGDLLISPGDLSRHPKHPSLSFIRDDILIDALQKHVTDPIITDCSVSRIYRDKAEAVVETLDGRSFRSDFVVAADGSNSIVRRCSLGLDSVPMTSRGYHVIRGSVVESKPMTQQPPDPLRPGVVIYTSTFLINPSAFPAFQTWGPGIRFAAVPTRNGITWFAAVSNELMARLPAPIPQSSSASSFSGPATFTCAPGTVAGLMELTKDWTGPVHNILRVTETYEEGRGSEEGIVVTEAVESALGYKGWESILRTENGTAMPTPVRPTATDITNSSATTTDSEVARRTMANTQVTLSDRLTEAVNSLQTAPLALYVGDAAFTMDPILAQGAGLAIETAYGLAETLKNSGVVRNDCSSDSSSVRVEGSGLQTEQVNSERQRDTLQRHIIDFNTNRYQRYTRLRRLSNLSHAVGTMQSQAGCAVRNILMLLTPSPLKSLLFDYLVKKSLY